MSVNRGATILLIATGLLVSGCGMMPGHKPGATANTATRVYTADGAEPGKKGFSLFGHGGGKASGKTQDGIGVNAYLWRASLDTLKFMPLASADPWGGVIITDWYSNPERPAERFKATVYILDTRLRADALNVTVSKQVRDASGGWADAQVAGATETDMENTILTRARQLRLSSAANAPN